MLNNINKSRLQAEPKSMLTCSVFVSSTFRMDEDVNHSLVTPLSGGTNSLLISVSVAFVAISTDVSHGCSAKPTAHATLPSNNFNFF